MASTCSRPERTKYSVVLLTLDTFRADRLSAATPNLNGLAASGVRFENSSSPVPLTLPAHASILSALLPLHHGLRNNGAGVFPADRPMLATVLGAAGYRTGAFVSAFVLDHRFGLNRGFSTYDDEIARDPNSVSSAEAERVGGETVDRALRWLAARDARPSFLWVHLYDAHAPYAPPAPYPQTYDGEIAYVDMQVGRLLAAIDPATTIVAVVGDHGEALGEHGELTHGLLLYEPTIHVPMIVTAPRLKSRVVREPVSSVDLAPTLAALAGVPFPQQTILDGRDLTKQISSGDEPPRAEIYAETEYPAIFGWSDLTVFRRGNYKYIASPRPELYDLDRDPHETKNVLTEERRTYRDLSAKLETMLAKANSVAPRAKPSPLDEEARAKLASLGYVAPTGLLTAGPRPDPQSMAPLFRRFEESTWASNENRLDQAIAGFRDIVARDPRNPVFRASLARALRQKGDLASAITLYQESVAIAPDDAQAWYNLAVALQEAGRGKEGGIAIREAVRRDPARPESHNALGIALMEAGELKTAQEEFARTIAIDPHDARAWNNMGNVYRATGRLEEAANAYRQALALAPRYADALNGLGVIEVQQDQSQAALVHFDEALQIAPAFYEAMLNRGIALQLTGNRSAAAAQFRQLLVQLPRGAAFEAQRKAAAQLLAGLAK
ncbi:MAG: sulfatase-like hydrolase/transferase [Acidobacteriota bacterium]